VAHEWEVIFILEEKVFGFVFVPHRTAHPLRDRAFNDSQPEPLIGISLIVKNESLQD
jgi:hypothetical protein